MILGSYEVLSELGSGTFGVVYKVRDTRSGDVVAMKCISKNKIQRNRMGDQVKKEINTMKMLRHPGIVQIKDVLMDKTNLYITMDYVGGGELYDKITLGGRMGEGTARRYFKQIMEAVKYCHELNICHRDIKPENILLDDTDSVKIADFGFASIMEVDDHKKPSTYLGSISRESGGRHDLDEFVVDGLTAPTKKKGFQLLESKIMRRLSTVCGTSMYMAPEIMKRAGYFGDKADIWSCGVVLYYLLMASLPFKEGQFDSMSGGNGVTSYRITSDMSQEVRGLLDGLLMYDPRSRFSARRALDHEWFHLGDVLGSDRSTREMPPPPTDRDPKPPPLGRSLTVIDERGSEYGGDTTIKSQLDITTCILKVGQALEQLVWMYGHPGGNTTIFRASNISENGSSMIQLAFTAGQEGGTVITLEIIESSSDIETLMERVRSSV